MNNEDLFPYDHAFPYVSIWSIYMKIKKKKIIYKNNGCESLSLEWLSMIKLKVSVLSLWTNSFDLIIG